MAPAQACFRSQLTTSLAPAVRRRPPPVNRRSPRLLPGNMRTGPFSHRYFQAQPLWVPLQPTVFFSHRHSKLKCREVMTEDRPPKSMNRLRWRPSITACEQPTMASLATNQTTVPTVTMHQTLIVHDCHEGRGDCERVRPMWAHAHTCAVWT